MAPLISTHVNVISKATGSRNDDIFCSVGTDPGGCYLWRGLLGRCRRAGDGHLSI
jgi:hypothetical protein